MYKMIVIDDEIEARNRIQNILDFEHLDFNVCGQFDNAIDALDFIEQYKDIDLVITDIKMPFMDGLELCKILNDKYPLIKKIIITGYDEFDYAKTALECGAIGYIMKPITTEDFEQIILKTKGIMDQEKEIYRNIDNLEQYKEKSREYLTESILTTLIKEQYNDYIKESIAFLNLDFSFKYYRVISTLFQGKKTIDEFTYYSAILKKIIADSIDGKIANHVILHKNKVVIILKSNEHILTRELEKYIDSIVLKMNKYYDCKLYVGVSEEMEGIENIQTLYHMGDYALMQKNIIDDNAINYYSSFSKGVSQLKIESDILDNLRFFIRYKGMDIVDDELNKIKIKYDNTLNYLEKQYLLLDFSISLIRCCNNPKALYSKYTKDIYDILRDASLHDELFNTIKDIIIFIKKTNEESIKSKFDGTVQKIIDYIIKNYQNPDLNLSTVADEMDLSISYICSLLKKEKNDTFVRILTDVRMSKAKEMLLNPDNKIIDIAEAVGFVEPYYFSHTFKKETGLSPKEYRAACLNKK